MAKFCQFSNVGLVGASVRSFEWCFALGLLRTDIVVLSLANTRYIGAVYHLQNSWFYCTANLDKVTTLVGLAGTAHYPAGASRVDVVPALAQYCMLAADGRFAKKLLELLRARYRP